MRTDWWAAIQEGNVQQRGLKASPKTYFFPTRHIRRYSRILEKSSFFSWPCVQALVEHVPYELWHALGQLLSSAARSPVPLGRFRVSHCVCAPGLKILDATERAAVCKQASSAAQASLWTKLLLSILSQLTLPRWSWPLMTKHCMWATTLLSTSNKQCQLDVGYTLLEDPETLKTVIYQKWLERDQLSSASSKDGLGIIK